VGCIWTPVTLSGLLVVVVHLGRSAYLADLCANFAGHLAVVAVMGCVALFACRRWGPAGVVGCSGALCMSIVLNGRLESAPDSARAEVGVLVLNCHTVGQSAEDVLSAVKSSNAALVVLIEPNRGIGRRIREDAALHELYPNIRGPSEGGPQQFTLSRWPLVDPEEGWRAFHRGRGAILASPRGPVGFLQLHPRSPRSPTDWRDGRRTVDEALRLAREFGDVPIIVAADLNSSPSGSRSRSLVQAGFARAKPLTELTGTYPAGWAWPFQVAIDDVWASAAWRLVRWEAVKIPGSDHLGVSVGLALDSWVQGADSSGERAPDRTRP
jgi:endonuclease/exonuclease/phosphatase (EEP) superfamily protein YafD